MVIDKINELLKRYNDEDPDKRQIILIVGARGKADVVMDTSSPELAMDMLEAAKKSQKQNLQ